MHYFLTNVCVYVFCRNNEDHDNLITKIALFMQTTMVMPINRSNASAARIPEKICVLKVQGMLF